MVSQSVNVFVLKKQGKGFIWSSDRKFLGLEKRQE